jgi:hypothetical protein
MLEIPAFRHAPGKSAKRVFAQTTRASIQKLTGFDQ